VQLRERRGPPPEVTLESIVGEDCAPPAVEQEDAFAHRPEDQVLHVAALVEQLPVILGLPLGPSLLALDVAQAPGEGTGHDDPTRESAEQHPTGDEQR